MSAYDELYDELGAARGLGHMSSGWTRVAADLDRFAAEAVNEATDDRVTRAAKILEEGPRTVDCGGGRTVVEAWSVVAGRALAALRGEQS